MIEQQATVVSSKEGTVWVEAQRQSTCGQCQLQKGCGTGLLANHVGKRFSRLAIPNNTRQDFSPGQQVRLEIAEVALVKGAFLMYIVPLLILFIFGAIAKTLNLGDGIGIISGFCGLFIGFYWVKRRLQKQQNNINTIKIGEI